MKEHEHFLCFLSVFRLFHMVLEIYLKFKDEIIFSLQGRKSYSEKYILNGEMYLFNEKAKVGQS